MIPVFVNLLFTSIELLSAIVLYKLFLYEETIQIGVMSAFVLGPIKGTGYGQTAAQATKKWGVYPGNEYLNEWGWIVPWAVDAYSVFFWTADKTLGTF